MSYIKNDRKSVRPGGPKMFCPKCHNSTLVKNSSVTARCYTCNSIMSASHLRQSGIDINSLP